MLIDWVTARLPESWISPDQWQRLALLGDRVTRFDPVTGDIRWESQAWDSVRSDSHQIAVRLGSDALWMQGSPARVIGDGCAVFGNDPASKLDLAGCVEAMRRFVAVQLGEVLPAPHAWIVSRVDITGNLDLGSLEKVREALTILRNCEGGRYRVSQQHGDTVYWSQKSRIRKGKAYSKGGHLSHLAKKRTYTGKQYTPEEINLANRLLRLELTLGSQWFRERCGCSWYDLTPHELQKEWDNYFLRMIGEAEMTNDNELKTRIQEVAPTKGQGRAAFACWTLIQSQGWEAAKAMHSVPTWYRHMKVLRAAGLGDADISAGQVVPLRRRIIEARIVTSWAELKAA